MIVSESRHRGKPCADNASEIDGVSPVGFSNVAAAFSLAGHRRNAYLSLA